HAQLSLAEQRLAVSVLGLPSSTRKERHYAHLTGKLGDALLTDMLDTVPCFLGGVAGLHLSRGKSHTLNWQWQKRADGQQQLMPRTRRNQRLIVIGNLWYLDAEHAQLGMLHGEHGNHGEARWLNLPPLPPEHSAAFGTALAASSLARQLPAPHVFEAPRTIDASPHPVLALNALSRHPRIDNGSAPLGYARLGFDYAGIALSAHDDEAGPSQRVRNGKLVEIERRRAEELALMERLEGHRLRPAVDPGRLP